MVNVTLCCAVVGTGRRRIEVIEIDNQDLVGQLINHITEKLGYHKSTELELYLAKEDGIPSGDVWMTCNHPDYIRLLQGETSVKEIYLTSTTIDVSAKVVTGTRLCPTRGLHNYFNEHTPQDDVIHIFVKRLKEPSTDSEKKYATIRENTNNALNEYQAIGKVIHEANQEYFTEVWKTLNVLCDEANRDNKSWMPFVDVEGSSGMGKTQLAFSLGAMGHPYFYWTATVSVVGQPIYRNFQSISIAFVECVRSDIKLYLESNSNTEQSLLLSNFWNSRKLWTFGLLDLLLKKLLSTEQTSGMVYFPEMKLEITRCSLKDLKICINKFTGDRKVPIFILDEMIEYKKDKLYATFSRDLFRVCCLLVVIMGTDSKVANIIDDQVQSRASPHKWLCLITKFPNFVPPLLNQQDELIWKELTEKFDCLSKIAKQSRGLFSKCFIEYCVSHWESEWNLALEDVKSTEKAFAMVLNKSFEHVSKTIRTRKRIMNIDVMDAVESHAYAMSYSNVDYIGSDRYSQEKRRKLNSGRQQVKTIVMHNHFANLERRDIVDVYVDNTGFLVDDKTWSPRWYFPKVKDDLLLYLAVIGCWNCPVFLDLLSDTEFSTRYILRRLERPSLNENINEISRNGQRLENMITIGVVTCSRRNGIEGIELDQFMEYFLGEFRDEEQKRKKIIVGPRKIKTKISDFCNALKEKKIPFLTPANRVWPGFIKNMKGCFLGELVRSSGPEMCDLLIRGQPWFIGGAKNWNDPLNSGELYKIIMKRWEDRCWTFGLIVTNQIIRTVFRTTQEKKEVRSYIKSKKINIVKVNCETGVAQYVLEQSGYMFGKKASRLVVILYNTEFDCEGEGNYELTDEESSKISSDIENDDEEEDDTTRSLNKKIK